MSTKPTRKRRNTSGFGFLSRAQLLEAKAKRLARELESWAAAGGDINDTASLERQTTLVDEIYNLEPQPRYENNKMIPAVVGFNLERVRGTGTDTEHVIEVACVAVGTALLANGPNGESNAKWFVAPGFDDQGDNGFTWPELVRYFSIPGMASLEVLR